MESFAKTSGNKIITTRLRIIPKEKDVLRSRPIVDYSKMLGNSQGVVECKKGVPMGALLSCFLMIYRFCFDIKNQYYQEWRKR